MVYDVKEEVEGSRQMLTVAGTVVDGLFLAGESVEVSADALDACDYLARAASLRSFESKVLGEVGDAAFGVELMSGAATYGYTTVYCICRAWCAHEAHAIT